MAPSAAETAEPLWCKRAPCARRHARSARGFAGSAAMRWQAQTPPSRGRKRVPRWRPLPCHRLLPSRLQSWISTLTWRALQTPKQTPGRPRWTSPRPPWTMKWICCWTSRPWPRSPRPPLLLRWPLLRHRWPMRSGIPCPLQRRRRQRRHRMPLRSRMPRCVPSQCLHRGLRPLLPSRSNLRHQPHWPPWQSLPPPQPPGPCPRSPLCLPRAARPSCTPRWVLRASPWSRDGHGGHSWPSLQPRSPASSSPLRPRWPRQRRLPAPASPSTPARAMHRPLHRR